MKAAWQFVARNASTKKTRPVGYGVKVRPLAQDWRMRFHGPMKNLYPISPEVTVHTVPYGTDLFVQYPGL